MRIAHIVYRFPCLSEPFIMDQITGMLDRKHEVAIFASAGRTRDPVHPQVEAYRLVERTRYLPRLAGSKIGLMRHVAKAALARPDYFAQSFRDRSQPLRETVRSLAKMHGFIWPRVPKFDIVHCQFGCVARTHWLSKTLWNAKLVVSFRGHDFSSLPRTYGPGMYKELFQEADAVTVVCSYAKARLLKLGCPVEKLVTHYSGTDIADFAFLERAVEPGAPVRLLTVARLEESKGVEFALRAVAELIHQRGTNLHYSIVGSGSLQPTLEQLAESLRIGNRVKFHGALARPQVRDAMNDHHVFLLPSVTCDDGGQEGIPGSAREAMATGMPVVSTWHSGIPELVTDGVSGFLVPERDVAALADRIHDLATHPELWPAMGRRGREHVERNFDIRALNRRLEALYRHVLAGGVPAEFNFRHDSPVKELARA